MNLTESFKTECVRTGLSSLDKEGVLREIARLAAGSEALSRYDDDRIYQALEARERIGSTAFGGGIALPHCALEGIDEFVVGLLTAPDGVDFGGVNGEPTRLIVFIVGPAQKRNEHVSLLSAISRVLDDKDAVRELLSIHNPEALAESFLRRHSGQIPHHDRERCLFHVIVQDEGIFNDIIRIFSSSVEGDISVIEAHNAGAYLNRMPIFAAFWTEDKSGFCRMIVAVVDKALCNDVVRRINLAVKDLEHRSGVLVTVQELMLVRGSLDF